MATVDEQACARDELGLLAAQERDLANRVIRRMGRDEDTRKTAHTTAA